MNRFDRIPIEVIKSAHARCSIFHLRSDSALNLRDTMSAELHLTLLSCSYIRELVNRRDLMLTCFTIMYNYYVPPIVPVDRCLLDVAMHCCPFHVFSRTYQPVVSDRDPSSCGYEYICLECCPTGVSTSLQAKLLAARSLVPMSLPMYYDWLH
jgi:hypothetical protein